LENDIAQRTRGVRLRRSYVTQIYAGFSGHFSYVSKILNVLTVNPRNVPIALALSALKWINVWHDLTFLRFLYFAADRRI